METLTRFRRLLTASTRFSTTQVRNCSSDKLLTTGYSFLRVIDFKKPKDIAGIPDMQTLWAKYAAIKTAENNFKKLLLEELFNESKIYKHSQYQHAYQKILIIRTSIGVLIKRNFLLSVDDVVNGFLGQLEPFPFDRSKLLLGKEQNEFNITVNHVRNAIEKQYLSWKYKVNSCDIDEILYRYRLCLFEFRSLGNLKRTTDMLEQLERTYEPCVAEKVYLINQKPFNINSIKNFQDTIAGLNWQVFPEYCPKILHNSHQYILFIISMLRDLNFTEKQIQQGLPFLHFTFCHFIRRLGHMLSNPDIVKYRNENKFLQLLSFPMITLQDLITRRKANFLEVTEMISISTKSLTPSLRLGKAKSILYHVNQFYKIDHSCLRTLKKHSKYRLVSEEQIHNTLKFLKSKRFTEKEVAESVTIVLYPRNVLERSLNKIESDEECLQKYGFTHGCVPTETNYFRNGTKGKRKTLQLCLYFLEQPYNFSGDGIWDHEAEGGINGEAETVTLR